MQCALCGAENSDEAMKCGTCDQPLKGNTLDGHVVLDSVDVSTSTPAWQRVGIGLLAVALLVLPWAWMSDLFEVPPEIRFIEAEFEKTRVSYESDRQMWDERKEQVLLAMQRQKRDYGFSKESAFFQELPFEVVLSYLTEELSFFQGNLANVALYPLPDSTPPKLVVTKKDYFLGFLPVVSSMEVAFPTLDGRLTPEIRRLRRGTRDVAPGVAWSLFATEMQRFRSLEDFSGGVYGMQLHQREDDAKVSLSYHYRHRQPFQAF